MRIFPDFSIESMAILEVMYCQPDEASEHAQHTAMILGRTLGEVIDMYMNRIKHIHVSIIPPIDIPIFALSPKCSSVASGVPV